jgi:probable rRNA maturation factor
VKIGEEAGGGAQDRRQTLYRPPWRVDVTTRAGVASPLPGTAIANAVAAALDAAGAPAPGAVTVVLTDDEELADLNRAHMGHEGPTDVLSFPMLPPDAFASGRAETLRHEREQLPRREPEQPPTGAAAPRTHIGDIAISIERAVEQAEEGRGGHTSDVRWSPADEVRLLVTHGTLHLCGWDHAEAEDEAAMRRLERELLSRA